MTSATPAQFTPKHAIIRDYQRELAELRAGGLSNELSLRRPFANLLAGSARLLGWQLAEEIVVAGQKIRPDGTVRDANSLPRGYWEAKDTSDDLAREIERKIRRGYPLTNTIFEDTTRAVLYQDRAHVAEADLADARQLADLLFRFYSHTEPAIRDFETAVAEFSNRVPELARGLAEKIAQAHTRNAEFQTAFSTFFELCRQSLNPNIRREAVDEMLVQHLLTERLFRTIFDVPEFGRRNPIAAEVERVIEALTLHSFSRTDYLRSLDTFYVAIEAAARTISDFSEKQHFINSIYERFFRGYSVKIADTHGIVYTPQPIVDYMCHAVEEALKTEFGLSLSSPGVNILDPCTGTGNFIVNLMRRVPHRDLPRVYREQLFANEVMLMPYYISSLNVEHAYQEITGAWEPFHGLCFVDTLDLAEARQMPIFAPENTERVAAEQRAPITVIIGNPPYNVGQLNENDNNKNRKYGIIDRRVSETYAKSSKATNKNALSDPYVKFFRWATDRLRGRDGIVCFVSNNSFVDQIAFDGMRKHLMQDFTHIDHIDLHGNVRKNPKLSGTTHNVFGVQVGVGITVAVRCKGEKRLRYHRVPELWRKEEKLAWLNDRRGAWQQLQPDVHSGWLVADNADEYATLIPLREIFALHSRGVATSRDDVVYDFDKDALSSRVRELIDLYNAEVDRYSRAGSPKDVDQFVCYDKIKWSRDLKLDLKRGHTAEFVEDKIRVSQYRPFTTRWLFFDRIFNEEVYQLQRIFPASGVENRVIVTSDLAYRASSFTALVTDGIPDLHLCAAVDAHQCFPFYTYSPDGATRTENITDAALQQFRSRYCNPEITKWDIFHYIYAILHHPAYRAKFADNLKRELPRIPFAPDFDAFAKAGAELARLHIDYEKLDPWPLQFIENPAEPFSWRVERMRLSKDKATVIVNPSLTLTGIPSEVYEYRLGNRSATEWVIDQYRVTEDARSGIRSDPNRPDDPQYIVRLLGQVVRVSMETVRIVKSLPSEFTR